MTSHGCGSESNPFQTRYSTYTVQNEGMIVSLFFLDNRVDYHFRRGFCFVCPYCIYTYMYMYFSI